MPRPTMTRAERVARVESAASMLADALEAAQAAEQRDPSTALAAWEAVEEIGATIHRQSRLLAGKSRGG